jgi:sec-independent protein translocase protein TatB
VFGIDSTEFLLIVVVAVVVIGPKDLPRALYKVGQVVGKARAMARHFRTGLDAMIREAELEELQKQWAQENDRIMAAHPQPEVTEKPLVEGEAEAEAEGEVSTDIVLEATAPIDPLVEAVKQSQAPAEAPAEPVHEPGKDAAA